MKINYRIYVAGSSVIDLLTADTIVVKIEKLEVVSKDREQRVSSSLNVGCILKQILPSKNGFRITLFDKIKKVLLEGVIENKAVSVSKSFLNVRFVNTVHIEKTYFKKK